MSEKKASKIKRLTIILLTAVLLCGFVVLQSCGEKEDNASTTEAETIGEITTTAEPTTPAPTEPPTPAPTKPPPVTESVLKWTFGGDDGVKFTAASQTKILVEDGILKLTSSGGDPFTNSPGSIGIDCAEVDFIRIKALNLADGYRNQLFFVTNEAPNWSEAQSIKNEYWNSEGDDWEILEFDMSDCDEWEGTLKQIRFDYLEQEGEVHVEYISFDKIVSE